MDKNHGSVIVVVCDGLVFRTCVPCGSSIYNNIHITIINSPGQGNLHKIFIRGKEQQRKVVGSQVDRGACIVINFYTEMISDPPIFIPNIFGNKQGAGSAAA